MVLNQAAASPRAWRFPETKVNYEWPSLVLIPRELWSRVLACEVQSDGQRIRCGLRSGFVASHRVGGMSGGQRLMQRSRMSPKSKESYAEVSWT